jgi:hypothetical protein
VVDLAWLLIRCYFRPAKGQQVPVGNITISGTSSSNATNNCTVSVIINGIRPYQQATSTGNKGPNDYSNWTFSATTKYSTIPLRSRSKPWRVSCWTAKNMEATYGEWEGERLLLRIAVHGSEFYPCIWIIPYYPCIMSRWNIGYVASSVFFFIAIIHLDSNSS